MDQPPVTTGVIGGSGLYELGESPAWIEVTTPYGGCEVATGRLGASMVAFLPRHGRRHTVPPHRINHRAHLWALHSLGVERVIAPAAVGSLRGEMAPGSIVVCDQFIDRTGGRLDATFFDGPTVAHVSLADPYCAELRPLAVRACADAGFTVHDHGTVLVVGGPRFSTRAESRAFRADGADLLNMTQFPEVALARELGLCYVNVSVVTDYDTGVDVDPERAPVTQDEVMTMFAASTGRLRDALHRLVALIPVQRACACSSLRAVPLGH